LGDLLEVDMTFQETKQRKVERILVNLNFIEGIGEEVDFRWGSYTHTQSLEYENVPFRCKICHQYGHLVMNFHFPLRTKGKGLKREKGRIILLEEERSHIGAYSDEV